jgi:hypothetical protein
MATAWAGVMTVLGLGALLSAPARWPLFEPHLLLVGVMLLAGGQYVFMVLVADRAFPSASQRLTMSMELTSLGLFLAGLAGVLWLLTAGL